MGKEEEGCNQKPSSLSLSLSLKGFIFPFQERKKYERLQNNAGNVARKNAQPITFMASLYSSTPTLFRLSKKKNIFPIVARKFSTFFFRGKMKFPLPFPLLSIFFLSGEKKVLGDLFAVCVSAPDPYFSTNVTLFRGPLGRRLGLAWGGEGGGERRPGLSSRPLLSPSPRGNRGNGEKGATKGFLPGRIKKKRSDVFMVQTFIQMCSNKPESPNIIF